MKIKFSIDLKYALWLCFAAGVCGIISSILVKIGNPVDGGVSISCFLRDIGGAFGLHGVLQFSYLRPEITGIFFGAFLSALFKSEFSCCGNSSTMVRFLIAMFVSSPIFIFVGCPMRLCQRIAGGDPFIWTALMGLIVGIWAGTYFLKKGFTFGKTEKIGNINGYSVCFVFAVIFLLIFIKPYFIVNNDRSHAPVLISLIAGFVIGILGQRVKLCFIGGFRNFFGIGDFTLLAGFVSFIFFALVTNIILGIFHPGKHIIGCNSNLWNFLSMFTAGFGFTLLGGCPFRQIILTAGGNMDSAFVLLAILLGAAISYNTSIAYTGQVIEPQGKIVLIITILMLFIIAYLFTFNKRNDLS